LLSVLNNFSLEQSTVTYLGGKFSCRVACWGRLETVIETGLLAMWLLAVWLLRCAAWKAVWYALLQIIILVYSAAEYV